MKELTVTEYAASKGVSRQAILARTPNNLPKGVTARKVGIQWVLTMSKKHAESKVLITKK